MLQLIDMHHSIVNINININSPKATHGAMALTVIRRGANSVANFFVRWCSAALLASYANVGTGCGMIPATHKPCGDSSNRDCDNSYCGDDFYNSTRKNAADH